MKKTILILVANPQGSAGLNLLPEVRNLQEAIQRSLNRERFAVEWRVAVQEEDLRRHILGIKPQIIHFCGHGTKKGLVIHDENNQVKLLSNEFLADLLKNFADRVECLVLNACETEPLAIEVAKHINYAIGMNQEVKDQSAITFSEAFYDAIGSGEGIEIAFEIGKNAVLGINSSGNQNRKLSVVGEDDSPVKVQNQQHLIPVFYKNKNPHSPSKPNCPYPGMSPFEEEDKKYFFGRDGEIDELLNRLRLEPFLTVIGASGSGKSSLVFAGLIPKLKQSGLFGKGQWCIRSFRPGTSPLVNLQAKLGGDVTALKVTIEQLLSTQPDARRLLLIVDQFEELFTQGGAEAILFQETLLKLIEIPNVYLILTVRADFYSDLMGSLLWEKMSPHRFEVLPLNSDGLKQAIVEPAEVVDVDVDPVLVERLLVDAKGEPGVLPLMQETLVLLWEKIELRFLSLKAYESLILPSSDDGMTPNQSRTGLQVAIARRADAAYTDLETEEKRAITRRIFLRLIQFGEGRPDTRRQQLKRDLQSADDDPELFNQTLEHLAKCRLITFSGEENIQQKSDKKVDLAHEALISGWSTLQKWITERRKAEQVRRRLETQAQEWVRLGQRIGGLLDSIELAEAERWLSSPDAVDLGYDESLSALVKASRSSIEEAQKREIERQQHELQQERKARKLAQITAFASAIGLVAVISAGAFAWWRQEQSQQAVYDAWSKLNLAYKEPSQLTTSADFLKLAEQRAQERLKAKDIDRALGYYRQIRADANQIIGTFPDNSTQKTDTQVISEISERAEQSLAKIIRDNRLSQLRIELKNHQYGERLEYKLTDFENRFSPGALRTTYKVLMRDFGAGADLNNDGEIAAPIEANQIPCETLKEIENLWRGMTDDRCGWYGLSSSYTGSPTNCRELNGLTLTQMMFNLPFENPIEDRLNYCRQAMRF
jgi:hypothetical protein